MLAFGREVRLSQDMVFPTSFGAPVNESARRPGNYVYKLRARMHLAHQIAKDQLTKSYMLYSKDVL